MNHERTVAAVDPCGRLWWFSASDSRVWRTDDACLYRIGHGWALQSTLDVLVGQPARLIGSDAALAWLVLAGFSIPEELAQMADANRLRSTGSDDCS
ncbi:MAG: hypothetical protein GXY58_11130 [Planctomycetaceae bacterium]|nr:hypothetical protein [Planctomycetaceae bacterium]